MAANNLYSGASKSCGCLKLEASIRNGKNNIKHGLVGTPEYKTWDSMKQRVDNPSHKSYKDYGGRGILICSAIRETPKSLLRLIGERPDRSFSIDRIDNSKHYSCGECSFCIRRNLKKNIKWSTMKQQNRNRRNNKMVNGKTIAEIVDISGLPKSLVYSRVKRGETGMELYIKKHERVPLRRLCHSVIK